MKKRRGLKVVIIIALVLAVLLAAGFIWMKLSQNKKQESNFLSQEINPDEQVEMLTSTYDEVAVDEDEGMIYVNNELLLVAVEGATQESVGSLVAAYDCYIADSSMANYGIYQLKLDEGLSLEELEELAEKLQMEELVDYVSIMPVSLVDSDVEAVYPDDPWNGAEWDTDEPADENWGAEAIHAPQAWAYFDEMGTVNVGLIDSMVDMEHEDLTVAGAYYSSCDVDTNQWTTGAVDNSDITAQNHGTHVAGTMVATWNDIGLSGLMGNKYNLYYSAAYHTSDGWQTNVYYTPYTYVKAISVLLDHDVQAINISQNTNRLVGFAASHGNDEALDYLQKQADIAEVMLLRIISRRTAEKKPDFVICLSAGNSNDTPYYESNNALYGYTDEGSKNPVQGGSMAEYNNFLCMMDDPAVSGRIIVVGAVGQSSGGDSRYSYSTFSCIGDRVDIAAPGENIYSCVVGGYGSYNGTSMAAPHVTATAGLLFASNENLTGPEVKTLLCASTSQRFFYEDGDCGLLDMGLAVQRAIEARESSVNRVIGASSTNSLDVCFLVDTTGSMEDDIANARTNMHEILDAIAEQTSDYRVALVDYRDFADRSGHSQDYPAKVQLYFTSDREAITAAIDGLDLGHGGDNEETVYSGFAEALSLDWRFNANKVIIVLGDAAPLDPEPNTNYTYDSVVEALYNADIAVDPENSDERVLGDPEDSLISIYTIGTDASDDALDFFSSVSEDTGGALTDVSEASQVSDAIVDSIEQIEVEPRQTVELDFGESFSGETVDLYQDDTYQFSFKLDNSGEFTLENMEIDEYNWQITRLKREGSFEVEEDESEAEVKIENGGLFSFVYVIWERHRTEAFIWTEVVLVGVSVMLILFIVFMNGIDKRRMLMAKRAAEAPVRNAPVVTVPVNPVTPVWEDKPAQQPQPEPVEPVTPVWEDKPAQQPQPEPVEPVTPVWEDKPAQQPQWEPVKPADPVQPSYSSGVKPIYSNFGTAKKQTPAAAVYCRRCGNRVDPSFAFCNLCGETVIK